MLEITKINEEQAKELVEKVLGKMKFLKLQIDEPSMSAVLHLQSDEKGNRFGIEFLNLNSEYKTIDYCYVLKGGKDVAFGSVNEDLIRQYLHTFDFVI